MFTLETNIKKCSVKVASRIVFANGKASINTVFNDKD